MYKKINNINYYYDIRGDRNKPAIVFLNSLGTDLRIWDEVIEQLGSEFCYVRYDMVGHGLTDRAVNYSTINDHAEDFLSLINDLGFKNVFLCGLSVGGLIAQAVYSRKPDLVSGIVLSNTSFKIGDESIWNERISAIESAGLPSHADGIIERWFSEHFRNSNSPGCSIYKNMLLTTDNTGYLNLCKAIRDADFKTSAEKINVPTICIAGSEDQATPVGIVKELSEVIQNSRLEIIENTGHLPCIENPVRFAQIMRDFFRTCTVEVSETPDLYKLGMEVRRAVLGSDHVDRAELEKTDMDEAFQKYITNGAWGGVWSRNQLTRRERSLLTIALLAALGHYEELAMHIRASVNTGASKQDITEVLLHTGVYAGVPVSNNAFKVAKEIFNTNKTNES